MISKANLDTRTHSNPLKIGRKQGDQETYTHRHNLLSKPHSVPTSLVVSESNDAEKNRSEPPYNTERGKNFNIQIIYNSINNLNQISIKQLQSPFRVCIMSNKPNKILIINSLDLLINLNKGWKRKE